MKVNFRHIPVLFSAALLSGFFVIDPVSDPGCSRQAVLDYTTDKSVDVTVYLVSSEDQIPQYYTARLQSPVCMGNLCREMIENKVHATGLDAYRTTELDVDVCVIGGGISGICTALSAARNGSSVVFMQDRSRLGGNALPWVRRSERQ